MAAPQSTIALRWLGEGLVFEGTGQSGTPTKVDGDTKVATSPVEALLVAAASCTASDVVIILKKKRVELTKLEIELTGTRRETEPRRVTAMVLRVRVQGPGADEEKVRQALDLSIEKYCSVITSLNPDIPVTYDIVVE
ncbi:MAG TPA: OsmC family protein [Gemmatimonadales bacterium]|nr:OsmC family protein [Gemmatimonadales bacterium]